MADTKQIKYFSCDICNFNSCNKGNLNVHFLTRKHKNASFDLQKQFKTSETEIFKCECDRIYKHRQSLHKHKKYCCKMQITNSTDIVACDASANQIEQLTNIVMDVVKQNQELQKQLLEMSKEKNIIMTNSNNNNTTTNKFNLQFFLNEQCKDAMNIMDFVKSLTLQLADLERVGQLGYAQGITKVFVKALKELDVFKRPIHCSDLKREILYVKDKDAWEKENDENATIKLAIKHIAHKNVQQIPEWQQENPEYKDSQSITSEKYIKIISHSMGGFTDAEDEANYNKIIKNVAKEVVIEK